MMIDLAEAVLFAMYQQAQEEDRDLYLDETHLGHAMADIDGYGRHVHLQRTGDDGRLKVTFQ